MRLHLLLVALALASCGGSEQGGQAETANLLLPDASSADAPAANGTEATNARPAHAPGNVAAAAPLTAAIPAPFQGVYDESREACARPSEYRLRVSDRALRFHESIGTVASVTIENARSVSVLADYEGEGEKWRSSRRLALAEDGATLVVSGDGTSLTRVRCP